MSDDETRSGREADNPFDAWLASAPRVPASGLCPWCSAPLDSPTIATCPACGAQLRGTESEEIPGLTVVDAVAVARRAAPRRPSGGLGVLAWLTGDEVLADAVSEAATPAAVPAPTVVIGPENPGAVAPPDERVRREMRRMLARGDVLDEPLPDAAGTLGDAAGTPGDAAGTPAADATGTSADATAAPMPGAGADDTPIDGVADDPDRTSGPG